LTLGQTDNASRPQSQNDAGSPDVVAATGQVARVTRPPAGVSVIIPTLNEAQNLPFVLPRLPSCVTDVIVVDGRSSDDTINVARHHRPDCQVVMQTGRGKGNALVAGFAVARGEIVVTLDADGSSNPEEIDRFVDVLASGADFAKGSRFVAGGGSDDITAVRRLGNWCLTRTTNVLHRTEYTDLCYGYNAFWTRCIDDLRLDADGFAIEAQMNIRAARVGLRVVEVPSHEHERIYGQSNLNALRDGVRVLRTILSELGATLRRRVSRGGSARSRLPETGPSRDGRLRGGAAALPVGEIDH
jgi:glycosyltransferase involved in cell wall biosynthesis